MPVSRLDIHKREDYENGTSYGNSGPYEYIEGIAHFTVDSSHSCNTPINDLALAPRNADAEVEFSADVAILRPVDSARGSRRILFDVVNRGRKRALYLFNGNRQGIDPSLQLDPGNGFLMRHGYTVVWCGWQNLFAMGGTELCG